VKGYGAVMGTVERLSFRIEAVVWDLTAHEFIKQWNRKSGFTMRRTIDHSLADKA